MIGVELVLSVHFFFFWLGFIYICILWKWNITVTSYYGYYRSVVDDVEITCSLSPPPHTTLATQLMFYVKKKSLAFDLRLVREGVKFPPLSPTILKLLKETEKPTEGMVGSIRASCVSQRGARSAEIVSR